MKTAAIYILGCRVNQSEGESFLEYFKENGFQIVDFNSKADIYLIHTCTVTSHADSKSRQMIRKAKKLNPFGKVIVTGCYAQTEPGILLGMPEVDFVLGMRDRNKILELLGKEKAHVIELEKNQKFEDLKIATPETTRAFLKIQEGCESFCSYCIIPIARGPIKSRPLENIIEEINMLSYKGYKEIILTGIHAGAYGKDINSSITELMKKILYTTKIERIRFGSLDPNEISSEFIELFKDDRFMPHIHLALQSGSETILKNMNRKYDTLLYENVIKKLRKIKGSILSVTTDIMVGFPGESQENHQESKDFIRDIGLDNLHIFKYSKRKGTRAANFSNQVEDNVKKIRAKEMAELRDELHSNFLFKMIGKQMNVLVEKNRDNITEGYSDNYLKVLIDTKGEKIIENTIVKVKILSVNKKVLIGGLL
ncbi:MAG: tRNA (N(6)-L-threonylcarbamoyladenosine(37)-C(2))-methylthiotransferase MtaB [Firmicutes bacterium]|nr:tRNA (N(6)-L-threonylcarbamoyladenosine(37)-C(2))-methylthiotransferase MtaB [Bacillota bacterium]